MWNNDKYLVWYHILQHFNEKPDRPLKLLPDLTNQNVYLNFHSKMTVKFAVPVLRHATAKFLQTLGTTENSETAKYCQMLD